MFTRLSYNWFDYGQALLAKDRREKVAELSKRCPFKAAEDDMRANGWTEDRIAAQLTAMHKAVA